MKKQPVINGNMATDIISDVIIIDSISMISYSCAWNGIAPVGTITVEVSNDYAVNVDGSVRNPGTWITLPIAGAVSNNSDSGYIDILSTNAYAIRLKYTRVSGSGTLQAFSQAKVNS